MTEPISIEAVAGFFTSTAIFVIILVLHVIIPAFRVEGYVHEEATAAPVQHRLNGLIVFICVLVIWWFELTTVSIDWLCRVKWSAMAGSVALSVVLAAWLVLRAPADDRQFLLQWVEGRSRNVQFFWARRREDVSLYFWWHIACAKCGFKCSISLRSIRRCIQHRTISPHGDVVVVRSGLLLF